MPKGVDDMDVKMDRMQQDINDLKQGQSQLFSEKRKIEKDVHDLQLSDTLQNKEISGLKDTLSRIQDDTTWIRRRITGAIITATITAIVGGVLAIAISQIYGG
jgi:predicted  nucleic acid-binding Zn-ribbon protein